jgi:hypothetical protein
VRISELEAVLADVNVSNQTVIGFQIPWEVLAGGFIYYRGHVAPIQNGVMEPAKGVIEGLVGMYAAANVTDEAARQQALVGLASSVVTSATTLQARVG